MQDFHSELDVLISPEKQREMPLLTLYVQPDGQVKGLSSGHAIQFNSHCLLLSVTARRGEELRPQKLAQRAMGTTREIGSQGTTNATIITNKCKVNKEGHIQLTKTIPSMDPLKDESAGIAGFACFGLDGMSHQVINNPR